MSVGYLLVYPLYIVMWLLCGFYNNDKLTKSDPLEPYFA